MPTLKSYDPPRYTDAWSFSGRGRRLYQVTAPNPAKQPGQPPEALPIEAPHPGAPVEPGEPRG